MSAKEWGDTLEWREGGSTKALQETWEATAGEPNGPIATCWNNPLCQGGEEKLLQDGAQTRSAKDKGNQTAAVAAKLERFPTPWHFRQLKGANRYKSRQKLRWDSSRTERAMATAKHQQFHLVPKR